MVEYGHQPKKVCRANCIQNCLTTILSETDAFHPTSQFKDQCSTSRSATVQSGLKDVNYHNAPVEKIVCISDKKGNFFVNLSNNLENTREQMFDPKNHSFINKGQAFFQKNRIGKFSILFFFFF